MTWCKNFQSMEHKSCKAGIVYDTVRDTTTVPNQWPCFAPGSSLHAPNIKCAQCVYPTSEEIAAEQAEVAVILRRMDQFESGELRECLHCGRPFDKLEQVGRCVYARPCGCRQYQGRLPMWYGDE